MGNLELDKLVLGILKVDKLCLGILEIDNPGLMYPRSRKTLPGYHGTIHIGPGVS